MRPRGSRSVPSRSSASSLIAIKTDKVACQCAEEEVRLPNLYLTRICAFAGSMLVICGVIISVTDFNSAETVFSGQLQAEWEELESVLRAMPLHVKASDQAGIQGRAIFDPV